ncbi:iron-sulfur cluster assembly factor IBA57, mitochondrial-like [Babylonia areolata]|uniref:iron-sulfur cluster assembly factor IBA57, mitochondrial-like n=1 Tax=Babylonia areolata TaxID=304850 RepID=UPI003FCF6FD9
MVSYCIRRCLMSAERLLLSRVARPALPPPPLPSPHHGRRCHSHTQTPGAYRLDSRAMVRVSGRDTIDLLQGLVTSDITEFTDGIDSMAAQYCMMLNVQGRVLYDLIVYNQTQKLESVCLLIECDASLKEDFMKAVKRYRIRKKVDITDVSDEYKVWAVPSGLDPTQPLTGQQEGDGKKTAIETTKVDVPKAVVSVSDPRVPAFGQRVLFKTGEETLVSSGESGEAYDSLRYQWGIPEGGTDLPPGGCLPLESNLTIMNGVSFTKGCYIGQELTARTHHTGIIRKRLLPLVFDSPPPPTADFSDAQISTEEGKRAGRLRGIVGRRGLGLVRLEHHNKALSLSTKDGQKESVTAYRPGWWPEELRT